MAPRETHPIEDIFRGRGSLTRRGLLVGGISTASLAFLAACAPTSATPKSTPSAIAGASWDDVVAAANKEGEVVFYATMNQDLLDKLIPAFNKKYPGIKVNLFRAGGADLPPRLEQEIKANAWKADVVSLSDPVVFDYLLQQGYVNKSPEVPSSKGWPKAWYSNGAGQTQLVVMSMAYNTDLVTKGDVPKAWKDVLDPKWKGKLAILEPINNTFNNAYEFLRVTYGNGFLEKLAKQKPVLYNSGNPMADAVAAGEHPLCLFTYVHYTESLKQSGAPIEWVTTGEAPAYGGFVWDAPAKHSTHPNAAKVLLDYILSDEGQLSYLGDNGGTSVLDLKGTIPLPKKIYHPDGETSQAHLDSNRALLGLTPL